MAQWATYQLTFIAAIPLVPASIGSIALFVQASVNPVAAIIKDL